MEQLRCEYSYWVSQLWRRPIHILISWWIWPSQCPDTHRLPRRDHKWLSAGSVEDVCKLGVPFGLHTKLHRLQFGNPQPNCFIFKLWQKSELKAAAVQLVGHCIFSWHFLQSPSFFLGCADLPGFVEAGSQPSHFVLLDMRNTACFWKHRHDKGDCA